MLRWLFFLLCCASAFVSEAQSSLRDTLQGGVWEWDHAQNLGPAVAPRLFVLGGETHDLSSLHIFALTLPADASDVESTPADNPSDVLLIVKKGAITISSHDKNKVLGPGGVGLFAANDQINLANIAPDSSTFYLFLLQSRKGKNEDNARIASSPFLIDWPEMSMKRTDKGESRQIFDRPASWLKRIDMHATTLDSGQISHAPHVHRAEEIILLRSGRVKAFIGDKYYYAKGGDLLFFPSGVPHNVENAGNGRCEYFALQWEP